MPIMGEQRFNIVLNTVAAVDYLQEGWTQQVIPRDIKSSNIVLDEKWNVKRGDSTHRLPRIYTEKFLI
jgi:serine/threonine protein kinase